METTLNLIKGDRVSSNTDYRDQLPVNMVAIMKPILGAVGYMLQIPGLTQYGTGVGIDRGGLWNERQQDHYRVSGGSFVSVTTGGAVTDLGAISGTGTASLPYSFNTQGIIADGRFWLYSPSSGFNEVTDPDLGDPIDGVWINGVYFMTDGEFLFHTDITDESSIDPLKFATSEFSPDPTLGIGKTQDNKAIAFNRYSVEFFVDRANPNFAYSRVETRAVKVGIVGTHAKAEMSDTWYLLGGRKEEAVSVHRLSVGSAKKVASREVDKVIGTYTETQLATAVVEARGEDGYNFLIVHLPNHVLQYNETVAKAAGIDQAWTIMKTDVNGDSPWRAKHGLFEPRKGVWVYGDKLGDKLGILDEGVSTHYGELVEWILNTPFTNLEGMSIDELDIETIPGHSVDDDATVAISLTYDGVTHGKEWFESYGEPGKYGTRFIIRRLGDVPSWFGARFRGASRSRMAFSRAKMLYG